MATWRDIAASELDANSPVTATLMQALSDNPIAAFEGRSGAPKLSTKIGQGAISGASALTITGLDVYGGVLAWGSIRQTNNVSREFGIQLGDSSSFETEDTLLNNSIIGEGSFVLFVRLDTGFWRFAYHIGTNLGAVNGTAAVPSAGTSRLRLHTDADQGLAAQWWLNGGQSAT